MAAFERPSGGEDATASADIVRVPGTRLNPVSTLPGYGIDYWPKNAAAIQVDIDPDQIGLMKRVSVGIVGDAGNVAEWVLSRLALGARDLGRTDRKAPIAQTTSAWAQPFRRWITRTTTRAPP